MANIHSSLEDLFTDIADALREKYSTTATFKADNFPSDIRAISTGGGTTPKLQSKEVTPTTENQVVVPDTTYDGLSQVTVTGDSDLVSANIKSGVEIFGVTGTYTGTGGSDGGFTVKTGNVKDNNVIETGLSTVDYIVIWKTSYSGTGLMHAFYRGDGSAVCYTYCQQYSSYSKTVNMSNESTTGSTATISIDGGTVTWTATDTKAMSSDTTYYWHAFGTA